MTDKQKIVVLGGGLSGLSFAFHSKCKDTFVYESEPVVGGLCATHNINGYIFDYNAHLLHFRSDYVKNLLLNEFDIKCDVFHRNAKVYFKNNLVSYPFQAHTRELPGKRHLRYMQDFLDSQLSRARNIPGFKRYSDFGDWSRKSLGNSLYDDFVKPYNEKFWQSDLKNINHQWTKDFFPKITLGKLFDLNYSRGRADIGYNQTFWYPKKSGICIVPERFETNIKNIFLRHRAKKIDLKKKTVKFDNGKIINYKRLLNTIPLPELADIIGDMPIDIKRCFKRLRYTSLLSFCIVVKTPNNIPWHWIYVPGKKIVFYRLNNVSGYMNPSVNNDTTQLCSEVSYNYNDISEYGLNKWVKTMKKRVINDLIKINLIHSAKDILLMKPLNIKYAYVLYDRNYNAAVKKISAFLRARDIHLLGRYGRWGYMSMEDAILDGRRMAGVV